MAFQTVFKRYELKYLITRAQQQRLLYEIQPYVRPDSYGKTTVRNVYFDTDSYRLIRRSIEKPVYKEKLRIRSYERAQPGSRVFVELKKKYQKEADEMHALSDTELQAKTPYFRELLEQGKTLDDIMIELRTFESKNALKTRKYKCMEELRKSAKSIYCRYLNS